MLDILIKAFGFILIIILGYILKYKGVFHREQACFLSFIIMNITLPCSLLSSVNQIEITSALLIALFVGLGANIVTILTGYFISKGESPVNRSLYMINMSGYNIGTFTLPFVQSFFPASALAYVVMYDTGNAVMCLGGTYSIASSIANPGEKISAFGFMKKLLSSIPFCTYMLLFVMSLCHLSLPVRLISIVSIAGNANAFLAMLMIGISLEIKLDLSQVKEIRSILVGRYGLTILFSILVYLFLPVDMNVRQMIVLCLFAPVSSVAPIYSFKVGSDSPVPAAVNSISMIISIAVLTSLIIVFA